MKKQYTLKTILGNVTATPEVLNTFIFGNFAIAEKYEKEGYKEIAELYRNEATNMFDELALLKKGGE